MSWKLLHYFLVKRYLHFFAFNQIRVSEAKNLFSDNYIFAEEPWNVDKKICVCHEENNKRHINCSSSAVVSCDRETQVTPPPNCFIQHHKKWKAPVFKKSKKITRSPYLKVYKKHSEWFCWISVIFKLKELRLFVLIFIKDIYNH